MNDESMHLNVCPLCGSTTSGSPDAINRRSGEVADQRRVAELEGEVRRLRETVARLRGSLGAQHVSH